MPQTVKPPSPVHFWSCVITLFSLSALWGNKNWPPSMEMKKMETFGNKFGLKYYMWSSLNAPGTRNPKSHPILKLGEFPLLHISPQAGSQKRVWICMDLYGSVRMSMDLQNLGPSKKYKMLISSCVCRNYDSAIC